MVRIKDAIMTFLRRRFIRKYKDGAAQIRCGAMVSPCSHAFVGHTVRQVRRLLGDALGIPGEAVANLIGQDGRARRADEKDVLEPGTVLEFVRPARALQAFMM